MWIEEARIGAVGTPIGGRVNSSEFVRARCPSLDRSSGRTGSGVPGCTWGPVDRTADAGWSDEAGGSVRQRGAVPVKRRHDVVVLVQSGFLEGPVQASNTCASVSGAKPDRVCPSKLEDRRGGSSRVGTRRSTVAP